MMTSYVNGVKFQGHQNLSRKTPTIFQIQDFIEAAWDAGINSQGRAETGGIKGTRKYIGTPEVCLIRPLRVPNRRLLSCCRHWPCSVSWIFRTFSLLPVDSSRATD